MATLNRSTSRATTTTGSERWVPSYSDFPRSEYYRNNEYDNGRPGEVLDRIGENVDEKKSNKESSGFTFLVQGVSQDRLAEGGGQVEYPSRPRNPIRRFLNPTPNKKGERPFWRNRKFRIWFIILFPIISTGIFIGVLFASVRAIANSTLKASQLDINSSSIGNVSDTQFALSMAGKVKNTGAIPAKITFTQPMEVFWTSNEDKKTDLKKLGTFQLKNLKASGGSASLDQSSTFDIVDESAFTDFAEFLLNKEDFDWTLRTGGVNVLALGFLKADGLSMEKQVSFKAINGFFPSNSSNASKEEKAASGPAITDFDLPGDAPDNGGIRFTATANLFNRSPFTMDLGALSLGMSANGTNLGSASSVFSNITLVPGNNTIPVEGILTPQTSSAGLETMSTIFTQFLSGATTTILASNMSVNKEAKWLNAAMKSLQMPLNLTADRTFQVVQSLDIGQMTVVMLDDDHAYNPQTSSSKVSSTYQNPFGFSLEPVSLALSSRLALSTAPNVTVATLNIPLTSVTSAGISTGQVQPLEFAYKNQPLSAVSSGEARFNDFFTKITNTAGVDLIVNGTAEVTAKTKIGEVKIRGIPINSLKTSLRGLQGLNGQATIQGTPQVKDSGTENGRQFIRIQTKVVLNNPSDLTIQSRDTRFDVDYKGTNIGSAVVSQLTLEPGKNTLDAELHYNPDDPADPNGLELLETFLQTTDTLPITITGSDSSSPFASLAAALKPISMDSSFSGIGTKIIDSLDVFLNLENAACDATSATTFTVLNGVSSTPLVFEKVAFDAALKGCPVAKGEHSFSQELFAQPDTPSTSELVNGVQLQQKLLGSISMLFNQALDVDTTSTITLGDGGYQIPGLRFSQKNVPYKIHLTTSSGTQVVDQDVDLFSLFLSLVGSLPCLLDGSAGSLSSIFETLKSGDAC